MSMTRMSVGRARIEEGLDLRVVGVVATDRDTRAAPGGQLIGSVFDRAWTAERRGLSADAGPLR
jgi:hypothetical protein